ncbi:MAG TPA: FGGY-family carbohydrate kinase [Solirubrobacterales bacterium]|nr:FGGY-family carbohydrate kinase [Solirubrobacterales bacterium]
MAELLLGIDIGTASSKAVLARPDGTVVATAQRPHAVSMPRPGWVEHDAEAIWLRDVRALCDAVLTPRTRSQLGGVCVSGIGPCLLPCDAADRPLRPAILYGVDTRAQSEIEELDRRYGKEEILRRGGSTLSSQAIGPKLLWLQRHEPELWDRTARWYMASSFIVARLTGEYVLDHHSASQCDPMYDLEASDWSVDWAEELAGGVPLPRLVWPAEVVGRVTVSGAEASGLPVGLPVAAGTVDAWAEAFSVGVRRPGDMMLMYGSTLFIVAICGEPRAHPKLWATNGVEPNTRCLAAGMATSGAVIEWLRELVGGASIETLVAEAAETPPGADGLLALPYFAGERSPLFDPDARGIIAGLTLSHNRGHIARAIYEATAFGVRHNLEAMNTAGISPRRVVAVGGGAKAGFWLQVVSDVAGIDQLLPEQTIGASYGDALMAGIATGLVAPDVDWATARERIEPQQREPYESLYGLYRQLYEETMEVSHELAAMQRGGAQKAERMCS